jgi:hypothetical protein
MAKLYSSGKGNLDWCADTVEDMGEGHANVPVGPVVGVNVQVNFPFPRRDILANDQDSKMSKRPFMR